MSELKAGVGLSRKWDAREAGREVAESALEKLEGEKPKFFLLFSTIHYEKYGGFQELLNGVWEVLPEGTPLIGGTVAGFMNNYGCFTRGATGLAVYYPRMDVAIGVGNDTKKDPKGAVESVYRKLNEKSPPYNNNLMIEIVATAVIPKLPRVGQKNVILSKKMGDTFVKLLPAMRKLNYGYDRADEIIELLAKKFPQFTIVGGCTMDDNKFLRNYQFVDNKVKENSLITLRISTQQKFSLSTITNYVIREESFKVTSISKDRHVVKEFDGIGARTSLLNKLNLTFEERDAVYALYRNAFYYPLGFLKDNIWHAGMIGLIYGENLVFANKIEGDTLKLLSLSVEKSTESLKSVVEKLSAKPAELILCFACETFIETLGSNIYRLHSIFQKAGIPFLTLFIGGESIYNEDIGCHHLYESMNILSFSK